mmetsp:Transcript_23852/g.37306  ORF Transcript_23852/g.37306 Transcript_23852/m.37306 type:complete len:927 (-) Transcript_23852:209-2989(-)|eukprot:CAMPEP_0184304786 /NCGR_PEP_ID=MMETSP1049-20130417/14213_1 /TAXON_ID=77928 /ORGANISM="Proteomonas sulcata, Strain CCMP704" /LENGTH=926 /DNA_ID=CAMNT_0026616679 /DNA_START=34 /DNA_END=2814 /DNA_ORIENTATION=+
MEAVASISAPEIGRKWICSFPQSCKAIVEHVCLLIHDKAPGWIVTDVASSAVLALANLLCSSQVLPLVLEIDQRARLSSEEEATKTLDNESTIGGLLSLLSRYPSNAAISAATAIGNIARRRKGMDYLRRAREVGRIVEELTNLVDSSHQEAQAEGLTALCNLAAHPEGREEILKSQGLGEICEGLGEILSAPLLAQALGGSEAGPGTEAETISETLGDALSLLSSLCGDQRGRDSLMSQPSAPEICEGVGTVVSRAGDAELLLAALDVLRGMLLEIQHRSTVADSVAVGSLLFRLQRLREHWQAAESEEEEGQPEAARSARVCEDLLCWLIDGAGRDLSLAAHPDGARAIRFLGRTLDRASQGQEEGQPAERRAVDRVVSKAAEAVGRVAVKAEGLEALLQALSLPDVARGITVVLAAQREGSAERKRTQFALFVLLGSPQFSEVLATDQQMLEEVVAEINNGLVGTGLGRAGQRAEGDSDAAEALAGLLACPSAAAKVDLLPSLPVLVTRLVGMIASSEELSPDAALPLQKLVSLPQGAESISRVFSALARRISGAPGASGGGPLVANGEGGGTRGEESSADAAARGADDEQALLPNRVKGGDAAVVAGRLLSEVPDCAQLPVVLELLGPALALLKGNTQGRQALATDAAFLLGQLLEQVPGCLSMCESELNSIVSRLCILLMMGGQASRASVKPLEQCCRSLAGREILQKSVGRQCRVLLLRLASQFQRCEEEENHVELPPIQLPESPPEKLLKHSIAALSEVEGEEIRRRGLALQLHQPACEDASRGEAAGSGVLEIDEEPEAQKWFRLVCEALRQRGESLAEEPLTGEEAQFVGRLIALSMIFSDQFDGRQLVAACPPSVWSSIPAAARSADPLALPAQGTRALFLGASDLVPAHLLALVSADELREAVLEAPETDFEEID